MRSLLATLIFIIAATSVASAEQSKLTLENFKKIAPDTPLQFVRGCLGKETEFSNSANGKSLVWKEDRTFIRVSFVKDKVVSKSQYGLTTASKGRR